MAQKTFREEAALVLSLTIAGATIAGTTGAGAEERLVIDVPAQALGRALAELSDETALQVSVRSDLVAGKTSAAVQGMMTPTEALQVMLAGTGLAPSALGQDGVVITASQSIADEGPIMLDQIVVEGELQTRTLQESQTSVAVITGESLERRSDTDLNGIAERTPGVTTSFNTDFAIRGVTSGGPSFDGGAATVTTVVDGARVSNLTVINNTNFSTWDLEQVEVLRGPQSTQTGRNALAGAV
ncbi:MAG: TonB-dependent receptor plug domain-containing protein, partial [Pseudomonadota bacterium]